MSESSSLKKGLKLRHMTMISLGGTIGAGLFVGSGAVIATAGPSSIISYLLAGILVVFIMRMLGEMAVARPALGSFAQYARNALGDWAGFSVGWLYWYFWVIVVSIEATAGAGILQSWFLHDVPLWVLSLILMVLLTLTNLFSVRSYGEFEFWFASIKVVAITLFLIVGAIYILGLWPGTHLSFSNLTTHGGFLPHGASSMFGSIITAVSAFIGAEIATIAASESNEPGKSVAKATTSVIWRVLIFYVGSIFVVVTIVPWSNTDILQSPYVSVMQVLHIPWISTIMNLIVMTAVLSCLNSGLYTSSRMLYALAHKHEAPKKLLNVNRKGVPVIAVLTCTVVSSLSIIMSYTSPETVFAFLLNSSGVVGLFIYLLIALSQFKLRRKLEQEAPEALKIRMWGYPYLTILCMLSMAAILVSMAFTSEFRSQLILSFVSFALILVIYVIRNLIIKRNGNVPQEIDFSAKE
ncbi:gamma-aminobutyrate:proton symporter (AAT family) [Scopulibacillus darangshiensis]|uniref:Gamma-aminobutyrate:proton symporter (AAT family) n=1 Tax=Scopulibacillus darangshiensis TaxID=442528 RepID=A0A4R2P935_9BACL|nr:amino acid permease [Scopulibacillus darangshiensis]TCP31540.1 gamma-aminobutyrate:proton symporter (AAT family) [Scopulibacillus darangshiensis]